MLRSTNQLIKVSQGQFGRKPNLRNNPGRLFIGDNMKRIPLTQGKFAIVDDEDYEDLMQFKWCAFKSGNNWYAKRDIRNSDGKRRQERMHRHILGLKYGDKHLTDHISHNGLDNRRAKIRICTNSQNCRNRQPHKDSASQFKGVTWHKDRKKWQSRIYAIGKKISLGLFCDEIEAAKTYDIAAIKYFGDFAYLNFPGFQNESKEYTR